MTAPRDTLVHITDLHFWEIVKNPFALLNKRFLGNANVIYRRRHEFHMHQAATYLEHLATLGLDQCLIGGDFTSTATPGEYRLGRAFVDDLVARGLAVHLIPGNHDVYTFESVRRKRFEQFFNGLTPNEGYPARIDLAGGTPLILTPTVCANYLSSAGRITAEEVEKTRALVEACPPGPVLVAGHYPLLHKTGAYTSGKSRQLRNADALRAALGRTNRPILYVAGHVHRFSYTRDRDFPALLHLTTAAFFLKRPKESMAGAFSVIGTGPEGFSVSWHRFESGWTSEAVAPSD